MAIHIGLIGGGNISETHARAVRSVAGAQLSALYGANADKVKRLSHEYGAKPYGDFDEFLAHQPMDMVMIGSPSGLHATQGMAAAQRGLHILTEKPIDISTPRADLLIEAAEKANVKLGVIFQDRVKPDIRKLKEWVSTGLLGRPLLADARVKWYRPPEYYSESRWRGTLALDGGGALINQGVHTVDLLLWLLGDVFRVRARTLTGLHRIEAEDIAVAILEFASGALGVIQSTTAAYPGYSRRLELTGADGTVILDNDGVVACDLRNATRSGATDTADHRAQSSSSPVVSDISGHRAVLEDFIHAIEHNLAPACDGRDGRRSLALIEAIYRAAQSSMGSVEV